MEAPVCQHACASWHVSCQKLHVCGSSTLVGTELNEFNNKRNIYCFDTTEDASFVNVDVSDRNFVEFKCFAPKFHAPNVQQHSIDSCMCNYWME